MSPELRERMISVFEGLQELAGCPCCPALELPETEIQACLEALKAERVHQDWCDSNHACNCQASLYEP